MQDEGQAREDLERFHRAVCGGDVDRLSLAKDIIAHRTIFNHTLIA